MEWYAPRSPGNGQTAGGNTIMSDLDMKILMPQLMHDLIAYLAEHPAVLGGIGVFLLLALIGAWYVFSHHLHVLLVTFLCAAGFVSGGIVLYRGYQLGLRDLLLIGAFLLVIIPIIYQQLLKVARIAYSGGAAETMSKGHARRAGA